RNHFTVFVFNQPTTIVINAYTFPYEESTDRLTHLYAVCRRLNRFARSTCIEEIIRCLELVVRKTDQFIPVAGVSKTRIPLEIVFLNRNDVKQYFYTVILHASCVDKHIGSQVRRNGYRKVIKQILHVAAIVIN